MNENNTNKNNEIHKADINIYNIIDKNASDNTEKRKNIDRNQDIYNSIEFSCEKKLFNTIDTKDKKKIYKNRFLTKINKNNSKERKSEGSFISIIHQKKLKLFSFTNE